MTDQREKPKRATRTHKQTDKAHAVALALHRDGFGVVHGVIAGVQMSRVIRPYPTKRECAA